MADAIPEPRASDADLRDAQYDEAYELTRTQYGLVPRIAAVLRSRDATIASQAGALAAKEAVAAADARDARRYRRLRVLGCAVMDTPNLPKGLVDRFTNLDAIVDEDLEAHPTRGEAAP